MITPEGFKTHNLLQPILLIVVIIFFSAAYFMTNMNTNELPYRSVDRNSEKKIRVQKNTDQSSKHQTLPKFKKDEEEQYWKKKLFDQINILTHQRNEISLLLNKKMEEVAILNCLYSKDTSKSGAFCKEGLSGHMTDLPLVEELKALFRNKIVGSFGDGLGEYKRLMGNFPKIYDAYDGTPNVSGLTNGHVKFLDLAIPQYGLPMYQYIISLEVAEHIPAQFEQIFLDNIARYATEGVVLSWAVVGQSGFHHINNRPLDYVIQQMRLRGFVIDYQTSAKLQAAANLVWLKANTYVYRRQRLWTGPQSPSPPITITHLPEQKTKTISVFARN